MSSTSCLLRQGGVIQLPQRKTALQGERKQTAAHVARAQLSSALPFQPRSTTACRVIACAGLSTVKSPSTTDTTPAGAGPANNGEPWWHAVVKGIIVLGALLLTFFAPRAAEAARRRAQPLAPQSLLAGMAVEPSSYAIGMTGDSFDMVSHAQYGKEGNRNSAGYSGALGVLMMTATALRRFEANRPASSVQLPDSPAPFALASQSYIAAAAASAARPSIEQLLVDRPPSPLSLSASDTRKAVAQVGSSPILAAALAAAQGAAISTPAVSTTSTSTTAATEQTVQRIKEARMGRAAAYTGAVQQASEQHARAATTTESSASVVADSILQRPVEQTSRESTEAAMASVELTEGADAVELRAPATGPVDVIEMGIQRLSENALAASSVAAQAVQQELAAVQDPAPLVINGACTAAEELTVADAAVAADKTVQGPLSVQASKAAVDPALTVLASLGTAERLEAAAAPGLSNTAAAVTSVQDIGAAAASVPVEQPKRGLFGRLFGGNAQTGMAAAAAPLQTSTEAAVAPAATTVEVSGQELTPVAMMLQDMGLSPLPSGGSDSDRGLSGVRSQFDILQNFLGMQAPTVRSKYDPWTHIRGASAPVSNNDDFMKVILSIEVPDGAAPPAPWDVLGQLLDAQAPTGTPAGDPWQALLAVEAPQGPSAAFDPLAALLGIRPSTGSSDLDPLAALLVAEAPSGVAALDPMAALSGWNPLTGVAALDPLGNMLKADAPSGTAAFDVVKGLRSMTAPSSSPSSLDPMAALLRVQAPSKHNSGSVFDPVHGLLNASAPTGEAKYDIVKALKGALPPASTPDTDPVQGLLKAQPPQGGSFDIIKDVVAAVRKAGSRQVNTHTAAAPAAVQKDGSAGERNPWVVDLGSMQGAQGQRVNLYGVAYPKPSA